MASDNKDGCARLKGKDGSSPVDPPRRDPTAKVWAFVFGLFLVAHGYLTLATYVAPSPDAPFEATRSWLFEPLGIPEGVQSALSVILAGMEAVAFTVAALGVVGVPRLVGIWRWSTVAGAAVSLLLMGLYFDPFLSVGVAISLGLLVAILVFRRPTNKVLGI
jgi:hypothetical protein